MGLRRVERVKRDGRSRHPNNSPAKPSNPDINPFVTQAASGPPPIDNLGACPAPVALPARRHTHHPYPGMSPADGVARTEAAALSSSRRATLSAPPGPGVLQSDALQGDPIRRRNPTPSAVHSGPTPVQCRLHNLELRTVLERWGLRPGRPRVSDWASGVGLRRRSRYVCGQPSGHGYGIGLLLPERRVALRAATRVLCLWNPAALPPAPASWARPLPSQWRLL